MIRANLILLFCGSILFPFIVNANEDVLKIVQELMPPNSVLVNPENPSSTDSIQLYDFNNDGQPEIIFNYKIKTKVQPSRTLFGAAVLTKDKGHWTKIWEKNTYGVALNFSGLVDITKNGSKEYLFGVTEGAALGSELQIFEWEDYTLKKISALSYHKIDFVREDNNLGIVIWKWFFGDSYCFDVVSWDGQKLVFDESLFASYYPEMESYYNEKISKLDAWYYWYCLADAQIKANLFEHASQSIYKGKVLGEKLSSSLITEQFNHLNEILKNKKNTTLK